MGALFSMTPLSKHIRTLALASALLPGALVAALNTDTPVKYFSLPFFDHLTGLRQWELQGESAERIGQNKVDIQGLTVRVFLPTDGVTVDTTLKSPRAVVTPDETRAEGQSAIYVQGSNFTLQGNNWKWDGRTNAISVQKNAQVTFFEVFDYLLD